MPSVSGVCGRVKFRARLRALLAVSALAPPTLVAEVMASDKDGWEGLGEGLSSLSDLRRFVIGDLTRDFGLTVVGVSGRIEHRC